MIARNTMNAACAAAFVLLLACSNVASAYHTATKLEVSDIQAEGHPLFLYDTSSVTEVFHTPASPGVYSQYGTTGMTNSLGPFFYGATGPYGYTAGAYGTYGQYGFYGMYGTYGAPYGTFPSCPATYGAYGGALYSQHFHSSTCALTIMITFILFTENEWMTCILTFLSRHSSVYFMMLQSYFI